MLFKRGGLDEIKFVCRGIFNDDDRGDKILSGDVVIADESVNESNELGLENISTAISKLTGDWLGESGFNSIKFNQ